MSKIELKSVKMKSGRKFKEPITTWHTSDHKRMYERLRDEKQVDMANEMKAVMAERLEELFRAFFGDENTAA